MAPSEIEPSHCFPRITPPPRDDLDDFSVAKLLLDSLIRSKPLVFFGYYSVFILMQFFDAFYCCPMLDRGRGKWQLQCYLSMFSTSYEACIVFIKNLAPEIGWFKPFILEELVTNIVQNFDLEPDKVIWIHQSERGELQKPLSRYYQIHFTWAGTQALNPQWITINQPYLTLLLGETALMSPLPQASESPYLLPPGPNSGEDFERGF